MSDLTAILSVLLPLPLAFLSGLLVRVIQEIRNRTKTEVLECDEE